MKDWISMCIEAFAGLKYYTPFYAEDFHPGGLCRWWAPPVLSRTSVMRLLRVWSIIPLFTHKISTRVVCVYGEATPVLPRTTVMRLLRVWSIVPLYTHTISTRVVCVNDKHPLFYQRTSVMTLLRVRRIVPLFMKCTFIITIILRFRNGLEHGYHLPVPES